MIPYIYLINVFLRIPLNFAHHPKLSEFPNIFNYFPGWTPNLALFVWKNMLCIIGNPIHISVPHIFAEAINCLVHVWDLLNKVWKIDDIFVFTLMIYPLILFPIFLMYCFNGLTSFFSSWLESDFK